MIKLFILNQIIIGVLKIDFNLIIRYEKLKENLIYIENLKIFYSKF